MRISSITKNAGKACNNRLYRHIRTFEKIVKNYFVIYYKLANVLKERNMQWIDESEQKEKEIQSQIDALQKQLAEVKANKK